MNKPEDYWDAVQGKGPLAEEWRDHPHRLVYDLVQQLGEARKQISAPASPGTPNGESHRRRHIELYRAFDELLADYLHHVGIPRGKLLGDTTLLELAQWSRQQTLEPTPRE